MSSSDEVISWGGSVEGAMQKLIEKVGVKNTAGSVMFALENGMVEQSPTSPNC